MINFKKINLYVGFGIGLLASIVYLMTMEATISFWDCGEFISCAYKLENPHPAGAPTFVLIGRIFSVLFGASPHTAVHALNSLSAISSGLSMTFLYWIIVFFAKKILKIDQEDNNIGLSHLVLIVGAGIVGSLAATFADSIWYSASEGEVYGLAMFLNTFMFWLIMYWYKNKDTENHDKWLVFIFFIVGLSIGVHLLNILVIPTLVVAYFLKRYPNTRKNLFIAFGSAVAITGIVQVIVIQKSVALAAYVDKIFVNAFGLPPFWGFVVFFILLFLGMRYLIRYFGRKNNYNASLLLNALSFTFIGYSTFLIVLIRANAFVPINMGFANNPYSLVSYLGRDQYGSHPFLYGQVFTAGQDATRLDDEHRPSTEVKGDRYNLVEIDGKPKYIKVGEKYERVYHPDDKMLFPRVWDDNNGRGHADFYASWVGIRKVKDQKTGRIAYERAPTFAENMNFFVTYQLGWMYLRYFMWNYMGRQNDVQGEGNAMFGNAISGIPPIDNIIVGDQSLIPTSLKNLRSHNTLFFLPFILGILGILIQYSRARKDFLLTFLFFFFNGLAIILYLNDPGLQPRERDYTHSVSYLAFGIWIGLGVLFLASILEKYLKKDMVRNALVVIVCFLLVPVLMASEEWDDHDRSNKIIAKSVANSYLQSCDTNALLMCYADNDTYPLWYLQEVEEVRTDVRVANTSLMGIGWYVRLMKKKLNENDAYDVLFDNKQLAGDDYQYIQVRSDERFDQDKYYDLYSVLKNFVLSDKEATKLVDRAGNKYPYLPVRKLRVPVSEEGKEYYARLGIPKEKILDEITFEIPKDKSYLTLDYISMLCVLATHNWTRPLCYTQYENGAGFGKYLRNEGLVYRVVPFDADYYSKKDLDKFYNLVINDFLPIKKDQNTYTFFDAVNRMNLTDIKNACAFYATLLYKNGEQKKAQDIMDHLFDNYFYAKDLPYALASRYNNYDRVSFSLLQACIEIGDIKHAKLLAEALKQDLQEQMAYYDDPNQSSSFKAEFEYPKQVATELLENLDKINNIYNLYSTKVQDSANNSEAIKKDKEPISLDSMPFDLPK